LKDYYFLFILSNYIGVVVPLLVVGLRKLRTINNITIAGAIVVVALWINRYLIVVPTLETPYLPIQDAREAWQHYSATWVEWSLTAAGFAMFCLLFTLASKMIPIVQVSELKEEPAQPGDIYMQ
jgi:molybdopterin-containing oxidoreductase family membrane subunit